MTNIDVTRKNMSTVNYTNCTRFTLCSIIDSSLFWINIASQMLRIKNKLQYKLNLSKLTFVTFYFALKYVIGDSIIHIFISKNKYTINLQCRHYSWKRN